MHLEEDHYFGDTAQCLEWFVADAIRSNVDLIVINADLTTYKQTIQERNLWIEMLIQMGDQAPVILVAGNHGRELDGDLHVFVRAKASHTIHLCIEPEFIEAAGAAIAIFPYPRKAELIGSGDEHDLQEAFVDQLEEFNRRFERRPGLFRLFFGHFGVAGARVSSGQPLVGRCAEYPLEPLHQLQAQYIGLSHIHLRQQLGPRVWYAGSLARCDYSEIEEKGYNLVTLKEPVLQPDLSDLNVHFRVSPARPMVELSAVYEDGDFHFASPLSPMRLKDARVKVVVRVSQGLHEALSRGEQERLRERLLEANPVELKVKIEYEPESAIRTEALSLAKTAEEKLRAYWDLKGTPPMEQQEKLLAKLAQIETEVMSHEN